MQSETTSFRGVRCSKFRHVYGKPSRREHCYENVLAARKAQDTATCCVNPKFIALAVEVAGGGAFIVLPLERTGRIDVCVPKVAGHTGPIYDLKWCSFNDNLIASASDDCTVKLWHIPDGGLRSNITEPLFSLQGHQRKVTLLEWHPTVDGLLYSTGYDFTIISWDTSRGVKMQSIEVHPDIILSLSFNREGTRLATTCRDKKLRIIDSRSGKLLQQVVCHVGSKASKCVYLGDLGLVLTTGFSRYSDRQISVWNESDLRSALKTDIIDSSSGVLTPYFDYDTRLVFIAGKGDGNIRYYEITDNYPYCHYLNQYISAEPQRGFGVMPKRGCHVSMCEVFRFYKLLATKNICEPLSMIVPRKSDQFQPDIFPDTAAPTPAISIEEWQKGISKSPVLMSMKTGMTIKTHRPVPLRPTDKTSDKNADKKLAFLKNETRADYRNLKARNLNTCDKDIKTSVNLDTKFQQLQRIWGCHPNSRSMDNDATTLNAKESKCSHLSAQKPPSKRHCPIELQRSLDEPLSKNGGFFNEKQSEIIEAVMQHKSETELRRLYLNQCEEMKLMQMQLNAKDRRIRELEDAVHQLKNRH